MKKFLALDNGLILSLDFAELVNAVLEDFYSLESTTQLKLGLASGNGSFFVICFLTLSDYCRFSFIQDF